jgi:diguanylate cyclase (GGDEF)-like protein
MYPGSLPYTLSLLIIAILTGGIAILAFRRTRLASANSFGWLMIAITEWVGTYAVEIFAPTLQAKTFADQFSYLGISAATTLWLVFAIEYTGHAKWLTRGTKISLTAWPFVALGLALTNDLHHWMWSSASFGPNGLPGLIFEDHGPAFWAIVLISYIFVLAGIVLYGIAYLRSTRVFRQQIAIMVIGSLIPFISSIFYLSVQPRGGGLDWTTFTFAVSGILLALGFFRYDLLNLVPLAAPTVIENLLDAVVVLDKFDRIVNMNPAAYRWLHTGEEAMGRDAHEVMQGMQAIWDHWGAPEARIQLELDQGDEVGWYQLVISSLRDQRGHLIGRVIVAHDRTREERSLQAERRYARQMELLNSITRAALENANYREILQTLADTLGRILEADGAYITLWDDTTGRTIPAAADGDLRNTYPSMRVDPDAITLTGSVLTAGHPLAIEDVFDTPYLSLSIAQQFKSRSILALPLIANQEKLGAALIAFDHFHHFNPDEISVGEQVGSQIALAIYKTRLLDDSYRRITQLALLEEASNRVADSLDEQEILLRTVEAVVNRFGYAQAVISRLVDGDDLEAAAISGTEDAGFKPGFRQKVGAGIIGHTAEIRQAYLTGDVELDPYYLTIRKRSGSAAGIPMLDEGHCLGVLFVQSPVRDAFKPDDIQTLQTLVSHVVTAVQKARLFAQVQENLRAITAMQSISQTVTSSLDLQNIFQTVVQLLKDTFDYAHVSIYLLDHEVLRLGAQVGYLIETIFYEIPVTSGVIGRTVSTRQAQFVPDVNKDPAFLRASDEVESEICVPLLKEEYVLGAINIEATPGHPLTEKDVQLMTAFAGPVAIAVDNARLHAAVKSIALTDSLTGLLNRRAFDEALEAEIARAGRYEYPLALIIIDLDDFKSYNDRWGHPAGDKRLMEVAKFLDSDLRSPDIAARYGGDEFAIILPYAPTSSAVALAERLRKTAEDRPVEGAEADESVSGFTISLGVASFPENGKTAAELLLAADNAELAAKRLGKNRVCSADDSKRGGSEPSSLTSTT